MFTNQKIQAKRHIYWGVVSTLLIFSFLVPTSGSVAHAQGCEGEDCIQAAGMAAEDLARLVGYAQVGSSVHSDGLVQFEWSTGYEAGIAGFNIWVDGADGLVQLNKELILATGLGSPEVQSYSYGAATGAVEFYIEYVTFEGATSLSPVFVVGEQMGDDVVQAVATDWGAINAEHDALAADREAEEIERINRALDAVRGPAPLPDDPLIDQTAGTLDDVSIYLPFVASSGDGVQAAEADAADLVPDARIELLVDKDGIYRVTHQDFLNAGFDLTGVTSAYLALTNNGQPIRMSVVAPRTWGSVAAGDAYIEFVGEGLDTFYTDTNVYVLQIDRSKAFRIFRNRRAPDFSKTAPAHYQETRRFEENGAWINFRDTGEPWYWQYLLVTGADKSATYEFSLDHMVTTGNVPEISASFYSGTPWEQRLQLSVNGTLLQEEIFAGQGIMDLADQLPPNLAVNGTNDFTWQLSNIASDLNLVYINYFDINYPRAYFVHEEDNSLVIEGDESLYTVSGLPSQDVVVYSEYRNRLWILDNVVTESVTDGYQVSLRGWGEDATYLVADKGSLHQPLFRAGRSDANINTGSTTYLIVSHADFITGLQPLIDARKAQFGAANVKVVDVADVYRQYGHGIFDAEALRSYLRHAVVNMGVQFVLLVGGDTFDYRDYRGLGEVSYIPSLYTETHPSVPWGAVDPLYVDIDQNGIPDAAIGRFPVTDATELGHIVQKTLAYAQVPYSKTAVFAADENTDGDYSGLSTAISDTLPAGWTVELAYLGDPDPSTQAARIADAKQAVRDALNRGVALVNYLGHSSPTRWTFLGLWSTVDVDGLTNLGKPSVVVQWGCWNSVYVEAANNNLVRRFLVDGDHGAAALLGSTGLTYVNSDFELSKLLLPRLAVQGNTIGEAMTQAKADLPAHRTDVQLGWTLLGDPAIIVTP